MTVLQAGDARIATGFGTGSEYVALIKTDGTEVSGGGYARKSATFQQSTEQGNTDAIVNSGIIDFGTATANWGTVNKVRIYTHATNSGDSNSVFEQTITSRTINQNDSFSIPANGWTITIS